MTDYEYLELESLLKMSESVLATYLVKVLSQYDYDLVYKKGSYLLAAPRHTCTPVCLVSHLDTVRSPALGSPKLFYTKETIYTEDGPLGADDRAGVAIILQQMRRCKDLPYILFTHGEEIGCLGARQAIKDDIFRPYRENIYGFIEYDRRGFNEMVTYSTRVPQDYLDIFAALGYEKRQGTNSDVAVLTDATGIAHVNLSAGYIDQHSAAETLFPRSITFAVNSGLDAFRMIDRLFMLDVPLYNTALNTCNLCQKRSTKVNYVAPVFTHLCTECIREVSGVGNNSRVDLDSLLLAKKVRKSNAGNPPWITCPYKKTEKTSQPLEKKETEMRGFHPHNCPKCGAIAHRKGHTQYCCPCGLDFYVENKEKVWYTFGMDASGEESWIEHRKKYLLCPSALVSPNTCHFCQKKKRVYPLDTKGASVWGCLTCLAKEKKAGNITHAQLIAGVRAIQVLP